MNLGERIKNLRKKKQLSQEELAEKLGIDRAALSQAEIGRRKFQIEEITQLADIFQITVDELLGRKKTPEIVLEHVQETKPQTDQMRIHVPQKNVQKFKEVLLYILSKVGAKPNVGETVLYKLLYFIDFDFYERYEEQLIGATYIKNKYGPTPIEFQAIVDDMIAKKELEKVKSIHYMYDQKKYLPCRIPDISKLSAKEIELIDKVLHSLSDMSATKISDYSHGDIPWLATEEGKAINYESVFYRTPAYSVRQYNDSEE